MSRLVKPICARCGGRILGDAVVFPVTWPIDSTSSETGAWLAGPTSLLPGDYHDECAIAEEREGHPTLAALAAQN